MITTIGLDADDTLWQNEAYFRAAETLFCDVMRDFAAPEQLAQRLEAAERRNIGLYGFGVKGFTLSMIETAIEVSQGAVSGSNIAALIEAGRAILAQPVELLPHVAQTIALLAQDFRLIVITKGDLLHQESKIAQSRIADHFAAIEIVSEKTPALYQNLFARHGSGAAAAIMVGNSLKSDVIPAIEAGAYGVHVPQGIEWALERATAPLGHPRFRALTDISPLPALAHGLGRP